MMKRTGLALMLMMTPCALATPGMLTIAGADSVATTIQTALAKMSGDNSEEVNQAAAQPVIALGGDAVPELANRLDDAATDDLRIQITYILAVILGKQRFDGRALHYSAQLETPLARLLKISEDPQLDANLAHLVSYGPNAAQFGPGLLALLERVDDELLYNTTMAAIEVQGDGMLSQIKAALKNSTRDEFSGDLATPLYDKPLDPDTIARLQKLSKSDQQAARNSAVRTLTRAGVISK